MEEIRVRKSWKSCTGIGTGVGARGKVKARGGRVCNRGIQFGAMHLGGGRVYRPGWLVSEARARAARDLIALCLLMKGLASTPRSAQEADKTSGPNLSTALGRTELPVTRRGDEDKEDGGRG